MENDQPAEITLPTIVGFSNDQLEVITMLCKTHFTVAAMANALDVNSEVLTSNPQIMEYIKETKMIDEVAFWESVKVSALNGDKNMLTLYIARINEAKNNIYE